MSRGDVHSSLLFVAGETAKPVIVVPTANPIPECCYILPLFGNLDYADPNLSDPFKEDQNSYFNYYDASAVTAVDLAIQKCNSVGEFVDSVVITNDDYGTYKALGVEVIGGLNYISLKNINWSKVLVDFGAGVYRLRTSETTIFASEGLQYSTSIQYDLKSFSTQRADKTVFFKVSNSGSLGNRQDGTKRFTFPADWEDGMRLPGSFGYDTSAYTNEYTIYNDNSKQWTKKLREPKYFFKGNRPLSEEARKYFENELMMADRVLITDHNKNAANTHIDTPVHGAGEFAPEYTANSSKAHFDVEFTHAFENYVKEFC